MDKLLVSLQPGYRITLPENMPPFRGKSAILFETKDPQILFKEDEELHYNFVTQSNAFKRGVIKRIPTEEEKQHMAMLERQKQQLEFYQGLANNPAVVLDFKAMGADDLVGIAKSIGVEYDQSFEATVENIEIAVFGEVKSNFAPVEKPKPKSQAKKK